MGAVRALLELRVDVHRHLRVGVADLAHHPLDVEPVGEQRDRDVGAPERVRRRDRQRRLAFGFEALRRELGRLLEDLADALPGEPAAAGAWEREVVGAGRAAGDLEPLDVLDDARDEVWCHLDLADAGVGLGVGDAEPRAVWVVQADVAEAEVAQLADA